MEKLILVCLSVFGLIAYSGMCFADSMIIIDGVVQIEKDGGVSNVGTVSGCIQGNGKTKTEERILPSFTALEVDGAFDVEIVGRKKQKVKVISDDNILPYIITKVKKSSLIITSKESICPKTLRVDIAVDTIKSIYSSGSNDITASNINGDKLNVGLDGSGELKAGGKVDELVIEIDGASDVDAKNLNSKNASVTINGAADVVVHASKKLAAVINGAGSIAYYGDPGDISKKISGSGDVYSPLE